MRIGMIGGTGKEGLGLALRWAKAGHTIAIGSRDTDRARERAAEIARVVPGGVLAGGSNAWAIAEAETVLLSVPYAAHDATLREHRTLLDGKIVIDITVPLRPPRVTEVHVPDGHSAAMEAQAILGPGAKVVAALHHVSSAHLADPEHLIDCDVLVCANDEDARAQAILLLTDLGVRAFDAGPLKNAVALEALTPVLIHLNKRYKTSGTGLRITGLK